MESTAILDIVREFGIYPSFLIILLLIIVKYKEKFFEYVGEKLLLFIQSPEHQDTIKKKIIKKEIQIIRNFLSKEQLKAFFPMILNYIANGNGDHTKLTESINKWEQNPFSFRDLELSAINSEYLSKKLIPEILPKHVKRILKAIEGHTTKKEELVEILSAYIENFVERIMNRLEEKYLNQL